MMDKESKDKFRYICGNCGKEIPYGADYALQDMYGDEFCSIECVCEYHEIEKVDWSERNEYRLTSEELETIKADTERWEKKLEHERLEKEAKRKEAEPLFRHIEEEIMDLVREDNE